MTIRVLVTGAAGFVGSALVRRLTDEGREVVATYRSAPAAPVSGAMQLVTGELTQQTDWTAALQGVDVIVHCAARAHVLNDTALDPLAVFRAANVDVSRRLALQAAEAGVRRFIYLSSVKANGEETATGQPFNSQDEPHPVDPYGLSKLEAERALLGVAEKTGIELVIIRPVLVYGPGVKANFRTMMKWLSRGWPLPLGSVRNRRSLMALDNLVDLIICCLAHPAAAGEVFMASDGEDLSSTDLLRRLGMALNCRAILLPVPVSLLAVAARALGREAIAQRLCGSLQVDLRHTCETLDWCPPLSVDEGLRRAAAEFRKPN